MFSVRLSPQAERFYRDADRPLAKKLARCLGQPARDPRRDNNITPLKGKSLSEKGSDPLEATHMFAKTQAAGEGLTPFRTGFKFVGSCRYRVGDFRVVYSIDDAAQTVSVALIARRRDVYE